MKYCYIKKNFIFGASTNYVIYEKNYFDDGTYAVGIWVCTREFPAKRPELLVGKDVKIIPTTDTEKRGFDGFFTNDNLTGIYQPGANKSYTDTNALMGKQFKVTAVDRIGERIRITLHGENGLTLYHNYNDRFEPSYPFEVIGGLTLPEGFYCDYITKEVYGGDAVYTAQLGIGSTITKRFSDGVPRCTVTFNVFGPKGTYDAIKRVVLVLENNKSIVDDDLNFYPSYYSETSSKYSFTVFLDAPRLKLLQQNKLQAIRAGDMVFKFDNAAKLQGILKCLETLN